MGYVATRPTCGPFLVLSPTLERWRSAQNSRDCVATRPICEPIRIFSPALKRWGAPKRQGPTSHEAHVWAFFWFYSSLSSVGQSPDGRVM